MSGQMRSFAQCYPLMRWKVFRHYANPEFFIVAQNDEQAKTMDLLRCDYGEERVHPLLAIIAPQQIHCLGLFVVLRDDKKLRIRIMPKHLPAHERVALRK